jgi:hypothetical protein
VIIPKGEENSIAIDLIAEHILDRLYHGRHGDKIKQILPPKHEFYTQALASYQPVSD